MYLNYPFKKILKKTISFILPTASFTQMAKTWGAPDKKIKKFQLSTTK